MLVRERPPHLLPRGVESWSGWLVDIVRRTFHSWGEIEQRTWGAANTVHIQHPMSGAVPWLSRWLDMPPRALPGGDNLPRAQRPTSGASERFVVAPGREDEGIFHMPGGQSGHPLSPFYGAGHADWEAGQPAKLRAGETVYELRLHP